FQHPRVFRQHLGGQQVEAGTARQDYQVAQQRCADTLTLVLINHNKGQLRRSRLGDDITAAADDLLLPAVVGRGNERDMVDEVDVQEKGDLLWVELAFGREEP